MSNLFSDSLWGYLVELLDQSLCDVDPVIAGEIILVTLQVLLTAFHVISLQGSDNVDRALAQTKPSAASTNHLTTILPIKTVSICDYYHKAVFLKPDVQTSAHWSWHYHCTKWLTFELILNLAEHNSIFDLSQRFAINFSDNFIKLNNQIFSLVFHENHHWLSRR